MNPPMSPTLYQVILIPPGMYRIRWSEDDHTDARAEGWSLADEGDGPRIIPRDDRDYRSPFRDYTEALAVVTLRADLALLTPNRLHARALAIHYAARVFAP